MIEAQPYFLPNLLKGKVEEWRKNNYSCDYSAISEILNYNIVTSESGEKELRFLRNAQFEALETYWYLRIVEKTPHIFELYKKLYNNPVELLKALGISLSQEDLLNLLGKGEGIDSIFKQIKTDEDFVKKYKLESLKETISLKYPSYILALAMGSGKTLLIGTIIATEFAMGLEYPDSNFIKNALVFAPGKTILGALKEISNIPFDKILPPRLYKQFMSSLKITFTKDNEKDIPIIRGSNFNVIVTNTEKIRIQKPTSKKLQLTFMNFEEAEKFKEAEEIANLRLQTIATLPNLGIFSDEAHHTYGQRLGKELKKVRKTVDYLAENTIVVVNTTGTPYYEKQMLKDVIYWYGVSQGIQDGILKEVRDNIISYEDISSEDFLKQVIKDFFEEYRDVKIYNNSPAKLAVYFPQTEDLEKMSPIVEKTVMELGLEPSIILKVHNKSDEKIKDLFNNRVNDPHLPYRIFLLVNMGTEGWNCPSLFATALARKLRSSNNFVLQAASRCLRQVPGNIHKAKIYLSRDNVKILDDQLKETYGESLIDLDIARQNTKRERIVLRKIEIPPISIKKKIKKIVVDEGQRKIKISLNLPEVSYEAKRVVYTAKQRHVEYGILSREEEEEIKLDPEKTGIYELSVELSEIYRIPFWEIYNAFCKIYPDGEIPETHIPKLREQIEKQVRNYKEIEEEVEIALALVKPEGFDKVEEDGKTVYVAEIVYHKDKADLLVHFERFKDLKGNFGFHYTPYNFDSKPEKEFFIKLLEKLDEKPDEVEDIYFTGAITDRKKTDFLFEYKDKNGKYREYTPDFVIRKKDGRILIVEIKSERMKDDKTEGEIKYKNGKIDEEKSGLKAMAIRKIEGLNKDKLKYEILLARGERIEFEKLKKVEDWIYRNNR